jgi:tetratricopeptide (TPR) repeat protein
MGVLLRTGLKTLFVLTILGSTLNVSGQATINDVKASFNQAVQMEKLNPDAAIDAYNKAIDLASEVGGEEADQIMNQAMGRIPKMNYESARKLAGKKDYEGAVARLEAAIKGYNTLGDKRQVSRCTSTILGIRNVQGNTALSEKNYEAALGFYDDAIARKASYAKAYLGKVLAYDELGDVAKMEEAAAKGIEVATAAKDNKTAGDIKKKMRGFFFNEAQKYMSEQDYVAGEANLSKSVEYGNGNKIVYYQMGLAQKGQEKWQDAIASFEQALSLETGDAPEKAKYHFELGAAYLALGNNAKACENYKLALHGEYAEASRYQIETVLKCDE